MNSTWIEFCNQAPSPCQRVLYFFEVTGISVGEFSPPETFSGKSGFLTGDVTHWLPLPDLTTSGISFGQSKPTNMLKVLVLSESVGELIATYVAEFNTFFDKRGHKFDDITFWDELPEAPCI